MILIGQFDSPFVRRIGVALQFYGLPFEHRPWSTFSDAEKIAAYNPLQRVPTLVRDDAACLVDSVTILDWLDEQVGAQKALIPALGEARRAQQKIVALALGAAEKSVSLLYERVLRQEASAIWTNRCRSQIGGVFDLLEQERRTLETSYWFGETPGHADIAVACAARFTREAHPGLFDPTLWPALTAHAENCERLQPFRDCVQTLAPPS